MSSIRENGSRARLVTLDAPRNVRSGAGEIATSAAGNGTPAAASANATATTRLPPAESPANTTRAESTPCVEQPEVGRHAVLHRGRERVLGREPVAHDEGSAPDLSSETTTQDPVGTDAAHHPSASVEEDDDRSVGAGAVPPRPLGRHPTGLDHLESERVGQRKALPRGGASTPLLEREVPGRRAASTDRPPPGLAVHSPSGHRRSAVTTTPVSGTIGDPGRGRGRAEARPRPVSRVRQLGSDGFDALFPGPDADELIEPEHPDLAVTDLAPTSTGWRSGRKAPASMRLSDSRFPTMRSRRSLSSMTRSSSSSRVSAP